MENKINNRINCFVLPGGISFYTLSGCDPKVCYGGKVRLAGEIILVIGFSKISLCIWSFGKLVGITNYCQWAFNIKFEEVNGYQSD